MSAASDRLAAVTAADFANGGHRAAFPAACNDIAEVSNEVGFVGALAEQVAADRTQTGLDRLAAASSAAAAAGTVPALTDRTVGRRLNDIDAWTFARSTLAFGFNSRGILEQTAIDAIRWDFDPATLAPLGASFAGARTNLLINPRYEGATVGTVGSGGVLPSNTTSTAISGTSVAVQAFGTLADGQTYVDLRYFGTTSAAGPARIVHLVPSGQVFSSGETVSHATGYQLIAGVMTGATAFQLRPTGISPGTLLDIPAPSATINRTPRTFTCTGNTTGGTAGLEYLWSFPTATAIDFTIRYILPQLQRGPFLSAPVLPPIGTPGISTRAQANADTAVALLGTRYNRRQGTVIVDWSSQPGAFTSAADTDFMGILSLGDQGANEVMGVLINHAHNSVVFRRTVGGVAQTTASVSITPPLPNEIVRCAFAWDIDAGLMQVAARGAAGTQLTGQTSIPAISHVMTGRFSTTRPLFGTIAGAEIRPAAVFGASLAALT